NGMYAFKQLFSGDASKVDTVLDLARLWKVHNGRLPSKRVIRAMHNNLVYIHTAKSTGFDLAGAIRAARGDFSRLLDLVRDHLHDVAAQDPRLEDYVVLNTDYHHLPAMFVYARSYPGHVFSLPADPTALFEYKFGHVSEELASRILSIAERTHKERIPVPLVDMRTVWSNLGRYAAMDGLFRAEPSHPADARVLDLVKSAYRKVVRGEVDSITPKERMALSNHAALKRMGIHRIAEAIDWAANKIRSGTGYLRAALTVPEHFSAVAHGESCFAPGKQDEEGVAVVGGPAIVVYGEDPITHRPISRRIYLLYQTEDGRHIFVPNDVYGPGGSSFSRRVDALFRNSGLLVHPDTVPPEGSMPAPSRHSLRRFYKDGLMDRVEFPSATGRAGKE
ncbi:MAG: hypothetical protein GXN93_02350, partial [Candidatus Diapherotrites archaeon]|nr:hypothetical protein [Candidatus Diapherotrites archaeon]